MTADPLPTEDQPVMLDVQALSKFFPIRRGLMKRHVGDVRAVDNVSFQIPHGRTMGLVGESGCGKTTVLRCIVRAIDPTAGRILFQRRQGPAVDVVTLSQQQMRPIRRDIQLIFQNPFTSLNPRMTLLDIIGEPLLVSGMKDRRQRVEHVTELLGLVGLRPEYLRRYPHAFSGGQRQRIGIARALALNPQLVLADEPVSALDVSVQAQVLNLMMELQDRLKLTYMVVSHDLSVIRQICDHVAVMYLGRIVETAPTDELFRSPKHPYTAMLLSAVPEPDPRVRGKLVAPPGEVPSPADPPAGCHFHPRCPHAVDQCRTESPAACSAAPDHHVACHRADELKLQGIA